MYKQINKKQAVEELKNKKSILLDIRDENSYNEGHVDNAIHLTQDKLDSFLVETPKETPVYIMCYHGIGSQKVASFFVQQGFTDVSSIEGGYEGWILSDIDK